MITPMQATPSSITRVVAIVPAGGVGARAAGGSGAGPKQYRCIAGHPMLRWTVQALLAEPRVTEVLVGVAPDDTKATTALAGLPRTRALHCGGPTRHQTVANVLERSGLAAHEWALVHDAARPGLPAAALAALIDACLTDAVGGLLALPVADTIKADAGDARVARTVPRDGLWQAQTPQLFRAGLLAEAFAHAARHGATPTDEASAVEALGQRPLLVPGALINLKVTWPDDFDWMEKWLT